MLQQNDTANTVTENIVNNQRKQNNHYSLTACLLCTAGFVTTAWPSTAVNLNLF